MDKKFPNVGDKCYLRQFTGNSWIDMVKRPFTVIEVTPTKVVIQSAKLHFPIFHYDPATMSEYYRQFDGKETAFYDTLPESIEADPAGRIEELTWHSRRGLWGTHGRDADYPEYMIISQDYQFQPYLD